MRRLVAACVALLFACTGGKAMPRPPAAPGNVTAIAGDGQVTLRWDAAAGATGYRVYDAAGVHDAGSARTWTATGLTNGVAYSFAVSALGPGGESARSASVTATPQAAAPPFAVVSVSPADGTAGVPLDTAVVVKFNRAATHVSGGCSGTVQLSDDGFATCANGAFAASDGGATWTFTAAAPLHGGATYKVRVGAGVQDAGGAALAAAFESAGFTTAAAAPAAVVTAVDFQHLSLSWQLPSGATEARVYLRPAGGSTYTLYTSIPAPTTATTLGPLMPGKSWDVKVTALVAGVESALSELRGVAAVFAGTAAEWLPSQLATGEGGGHFRFTWSDTDFFAAYSSAADDATLQAASADALWIAFDTDPDTDATGEATTRTGLNGQIIWPFKADYVVELKTDQANLRTVSTGAWTALAATAMRTSRIAELRFAKSAIGNPAKVRIALAAISTHAGDAQPASVYDLAPARQAPVNVPTLGQLASLTDAFAPGAFDASDAATSAQAGFATAPALVHFALTGLVPLGMLQLAGNLPPLSADLSRSEYALVKTDPQTYEGTFNFGGKAGELAFKFMDDGLPEPAFATGGVDRILTLSGAAQRVPELIWSTVFDANHSFTLTFVVQGAAPTALRGNTSELGGAGAPMTSGGGGVTTGPIVFDSHDFTTSPLTFKAYFPDGSSEAATHSMNDDVINARTLVWTAGDGTTF